MNTPANSDSSTTSPVVIESVYSPAASEIWTVKQETKYTTFQRSSNNDIDQEIFLRALK